MASNDKQMQPQTIGPHGAMAPFETEPVYSKYTTGDVTCIADQAQNGGWLPQANPVNGIVPMLDTIGSAGNYVAAPDDDISKPADQLVPERGD